MNIFYTYPLPQMKKTSSKYPNWSSNCRTA